MLAVGIYGLFGFHFFLFLALRLAPPLQANVVNYLWPLLLVLLAPLFLADARLTGRHVAGALLGLAGAALAIATSPHASSASDAARPHAALGYAAALASALIWATYSLATRRLHAHGVRFPTAAIGAFCLLSGLLALACHALLEPAHRWTATEWPPLLALAIGPMGAAFFLWDAALKRGDARTIGTLAYATPVASTLLLGLGDAARFGWPIVVALALVVSGAVVGSRTGRAARAAR